MGFFRKLLEENEAFRNSVKAYMAPDNDMGSLVEVQTPHRSSGSVEETWETTLRTARSSGSFEETWETTLKTAAGVRLATASISESIYGGARSIMAYVKAKEGSPVVFGLCTAEHDADHAGRTSPAVVFGKLYDSNRKLLQESRNDLEGKKGAYVSQWEYSQTASPARPVITVTHSHIPSGNMSHEKQILEKVENVYDVDLEKYWLSWDEIRGHDLISRDVFRYKDGAFIQYASESFGDPGEHGGKFFSGDRFASGRAVDLSSGRDDVLSFDSEEFEDNFLKRKYEYSEVHDSEYAGWYDRDADGIKKASYELAQDARTKKETYTVYDEKGRNDATACFEYESELAENGHPGRILKVSFNTYEHDEKGNIISREYFLGNFRDYTRNSFGTFFRPHTDGLQYKGGTVSGPDRWSLPGIVKDSVESLAKVERLMNYTGMTEPKLLCETDNIRVFVSDTPLTAFAHTSPVSGETFPATVTLDTRAGTIIVSMADKGIGRLAGESLDKMLTAIKKEGYEPGTPLQCFGGISSTGMGTAPIEMLSRTVVEVEKAVEKPVTLEDYMELEQLGKDITDHARDAVKRLGLDVKVFDSQAIESTL